MKHARILFSLILLTTFAMAVSGCTLATVRSLKEDEIAKEGFSPEAYVDGIWEDQFLPTINGESQEIGELLTALEANQKSAAEEFGNRTSNGAYSFMTYGEAKILELDRSSRVGLAPMDLAPYDGEADVYLAIGPVLRGNALRDAVGFIIFNDFTNQVEFAGVSTALKDRITSDVLGQVDLESLVEKTVRFVGAFTFDDPEEVVIMPVSLEEVE
ncbi:MAG: DUF2291 domain-containing protein [Anaerolineae bacterium]|nr:DUF2291 domain-containing protein [Anaerolineae bacterium]